MPISFTRYVDITSAVAGANAVPVRQLIGRLVTNNPLLPDGSFIEFNSAADVGAYFGTSSAEYARALFYFAWISKSVTQAQKISYAAWSNVARAPQIFGNQTPVSLTTLQAITAGAFQITLGGVTGNIGPINLATAGSFAAVAAAIQTAIQGAQSGTLWTAATVTYNASLNQFNFTGGLSGVCSLSVVDGAQSLATALGWLPVLPSNGEQITSGNLINYAIWAPGSAVEDIAASVAASAAASNNFGSLLVIPTLTQSQTVELAEFIASSNVLYRYDVPVTAANAAEYSAALIGFEGTELTLSPVSGQFPEMCQMIIEAATNYSLRNSSCNYMFTQFGGLTPSVNDDSDANTYDALRVNYYGQTQESGVNISFYQRGVMMGGDSAPVSANVFSNESWLKSAIGASIINLQLALTQIPANVAGENAIMGQIVGVIGSSTTPNTALYNGVIEPGKTLNTTQQAAINQFTGDNNAWRQVQTTGWWLDVEIIPYVDPTNNTPGYEAIYSLVYSKDDVVNFVTGSNVLI